ncbi:hypothetical protein GCM10018790_02040 [Kitasatospora xanthocidica]|uniref:hypothetical protein n=1 Tax=Kitasatospora xanthocidica TaxID=83382 RepID=UPI001679A4B7|nr:hypothetical protein [Kitasatospora xanthocidica]GHF28227.1 hypothetical protein GCM10018790_02040 [Kitasatospora xanthocidica]
MSSPTQRRKVRLSQHQTAESPFGPIQIDYDRWPSVVARLHGAGIPVVTVVPGREHGAMTLNGHHVPAKERASGWDPRRKARTRTALLGDRTYELRPVSLRRAELRRNGVLIAEARGGLRSYSPGRSIPGLGARVAWSHGVDPTDVAVGQAMVLAFGAGAPGAVLGALLFWVDNTGTG